jgi:hypothetical protein
LRSHFPTARTSSTLKWLMVACLLSEVCLAQTLAIAKLEGLREAATDTDRPDARPVTASPVLAHTLPEAPNQHRFWDRRNRIAFASVAALSAADFAVTRANLQNGGKELNPVTRLFSGSTGGLAVNFAGETAGIVGLSYYLHKRGHHRLERIAPLLNIGASCLAVGFDLGHR